MADGGQQDADASAVLGASLGLSGECGTAQQLVELLQGGGTTHITLSDNIVFTERVQIGTGLNPVTILMGDFGITVAEGVDVFIYRKVLFQGNGVATPLLTLENGSRMQLTNDSKLTAAEHDSVAVRSYGGWLQGGVSVYADGQGATAFEGYSGGSMDVSKITLYARGNGGTAARVDAEAARFDCCKLIAADIALDVTGDVMLRLDTRIHSDNIALSSSGSVDANRTNIVGSVAVGGSVDAVLCDIEGSVSSGGKITLDTCYAAPVPDGATIITRRTEWFHTIVDRSLVETYGFCIAPGDEPDLPDTLTVGIWEAEKSKAFSYVNVDVISWKEVEGDTTSDVTGWLEAELDIPRFLYGSVTGRTVRCPVRSYDPQQPYLVSVTVGDKERKMTVVDAQEFEGADEVLLHVSVNDGESWTTYSSLDPFGKTYYRWGVSHYFIPVDETAHLFQYEVLGGDVTGRSNILRTWYSESGTQDPLTGDREGDGRDDGDEPGGTEPPGPGDGGGSSEEDGDKGGNGDNGGNTGSSSRNTGGFGGGGRGRRESAASFVPADSTSAARQIPADGTAPTATTQSADAAQGETLPVAAGETARYPEGATVYTAAELSALALSNPERIAFLEGSLQAVLPTPALLEAVDGGSFAILLEQSGGQGFHIRLYTESGELKGLGGAVFQVSLPLSDGYENPLCTGADGGEAPTRVENGRIVCDLTRTGRYEIAAGPSAAVIATENEPKLEPGSPAMEPAGEDAPSSIQAAWWVALSSVAVCAAGFVFLRRRVRFG